MRRREEREAAEARRREEELREAKRQQQRLNFLLTQTELYSHFMHAKGGQAGAGPVGASAGKPEGEGAPGEDEEEDEEERAMREEAMRSATLAASAARTQMNNFDDESRALRDSEEGEPGTGPEAPEGGSSMDLLHPYGPFPSLPPPCPTLFSLLLFLSFGPAPQCLHCCSLRLPMSSLESRLAVQWWRLSPGWLWRRGRGVGGAAMQVHNARDVDSAAAEHVPGHPQKLPAQGIAVACQPLRPGGAPSPCWPMLGVALHSPM